MRANPWSLPAAQQFLAEVEPLIWDGGAVLTCDVSTPAGLAEQLVQHLREHMHLIRIEAQPGTLPLAALGDACGRAGGSMAQVIEDERVFLIEAKELGATDLARWSHTLQEFAAQRKGRGHGAAVLFLGAANVPGLACLTWTRRLRRVDAMIWAEYAVPVARNEVMQRLAVDLAVELCGWRLDLISDLVSQREEDILEPMGWLRRNADLAVREPASFGASGFACPLHLLSVGDEAEVRRRIWSAQLTVLFPWIEERRQWLVARYRKQLYVDDHLKSLGVMVAEDIELGGLRKQLLPFLARDDAEKLTALARLRNDLAHRKPVSADDFFLGRRLKVEG